MANNLNFCLVNNLSLKRCKVLSLWATFKGNIIQLFWSTSFFRSGVQKKMLSSAWRSASLTVTRNGPNDGSILPDGFTAEKTYIYRLKTKHSWILLIRCFKKSHILKKIAVQITMYIHYRQAWDLFYFS